MNSKDLLHNILSDMRVELSEEFDRNFERKAFFTDKWKKRANPNAKGSQSEYLSRQRSFEAWTNIDGSKPHANIDL